MTRARHIRTARAYKGFTLLETVLALAVASLVVLSALSLMWFMGRGDASLLTREQQAQQMERVHLVARRISSNLLLADRTGDPARVARETPEEREARRARDRANRPPARFILTPDPALSDSRMTRRFGQALSIQPQRLEVVLTQAPVPRGESPPFRVAEEYAVERADMLALSRRRDNAENGSSGDREGSGPDSQPRREGASGRDVGESRAEPADDAQDDPFSSDLFASENRLGDSADDRASNEPSAASERNSVSGASSATPAAHRGVLELRPMLDPLTQVSASDEPVRYALWWRPLPLQRPDEDRLDPDRADDVRARRERQRSQLMPVLVAEDLTFVRWRVFKRRAWTDQFIATEENDLPAFVELEVQTADGLWSNWLLEVGWTTGAEAPPPPRPEPSATDEPDAPRQEGDANDPPGRGGGTGAGGVGAGGGAAGSRQPGGERRPGGRP